MDAIVNLWKGFLITEEEVVLNVEDESFAKSNTRLPFELLGRFTTKRPIHNGVFQEMLEMERQRVLD
ncbi:hypothetical protein TorRG33x02_315870 [Trema orientale]|uniref:Uncharacterized protein n=1 Tax=Trema orientale TaxID=63057 RepID=A0A2P5BM89_TREOI|nr:hypothetical protein TorRG33x02_315870 [Trema orientale]